MEQQIHGAAAHPCRNTNSMQEHQFHAGAAAPWKSSNSMQQQQLHGGAAVPCQEHQFHGGRCPRAQDGLGRACLTFAGEDSTSCANPADLGSAFSRHLERKCFKCISLKELLQHWDLFLAKPCSTGSSNTGRNWRLPPSQHTDMNAVKGEA